MKFPSALTTIAVGVTVSHPEAVADPIGEAAGATVA